MIVSGGTQNHLMLVDMIGKPVSPARTPRRRWAGAHHREQRRRCRTIRRSPFVTSGLRIGTPAVTTRGYKPIAWRWQNWICDVLSTPGGRA